MATRGRKPGRKKKETKAEEVEVAPVEEVVEPVVKTKEKFKPVKKELPTVVEPVKETPTPVVEEKVKEVVVPVKETPAPVVEEKVKEEQAILQPLEKQVQIKKEVKVETVVETPQIMNSGSIVTMPTGHQAIIVGQDSKGRFLVRKTSNPRKTYAFYATQLSLVK